MDRFIGLNGWVAVAWIINGWMVNGGRHLPGRMDEWVDGLRDGHLGGWMVGSSRRSHFPQSHATPSFFSVAFPNQLTS